MRTFALFLTGLIMSLGCRAEQAQQIFQDLAPGLYQIRLIENASGEKSSIGSGFQIDPQGTLATNYHVISGVARHPDKYHLEYFDHQGQKGELQLLSVDVINDLALLKKAPGDTDRYFPLAGAAPTQGQELFSLGNPHDLGMIVVPGVYNGLKKESFNDRIHFTGAVNSGMSGGPTVNRGGEVVGVNVASAGNQIGFLVPHDKLVNLYRQLRARPDAAVSAADIDSQIHRQLLDNQQRLLNTLLERPWPVKKLGNANIPGAIAPFIRCWGNSNADNRNALVFSAVSNCSLNEEVYLSNNFRTGIVNMQFNWLDAKELGSIRFYNLYESQMRNARPDNAATENDVGEFSCHQDLVNIDQRQITNKAVFCTRAYKKYPGLFDVLYIAASVDSNSQGLVSHFTLAGVERSLALQFTRKFMESATWN